MATITMKQLLESGIHFGHQTRRWNPKMGRYIFGERHGIYIIDLQKTLRQLRRAYITVRDSVAEGGAVLFVGTKKQARESVQEQAERCGMYYVNNRWLGGTLTNWQTIQNSISKLINLQEMEAAGKFEQFKKKEAISLRKKCEKLDKNLAGIKNMAGPPTIMFVVDSHRETIAVREAERLGITSIAICDTNSDPDEVTIPIPGNDDAIRAINLFCTIIADAAIEGRMQYEKQQEEEAAKAAAEAAKAVKSAKVARQQAKAGELDEEASEAESADGAAEAEAPAPAPEKAAPADSGQEESEDLAKAPEA
ncbi:MAG: 30S ribosomal protein S2 [Candidatus Hydrogenedentes bacterium]|nr:30S ribosomal protein S2 [Candidatus Hydrogenedentota bacterium]